MKPSLLNDSFFDGLESSILDIENAETLPPACYTDAEFYEFEKASLFDKEWLCVGRESWAAKPGDYFTTSIVGEPIIVARTSDGVLHAMSAVCQHRAMLVAEGSGNTRSFMCPYHHWVYGLDGTLRSAPAMEKTCDFEKGDVRLPKFRVEIWQGFVFINFDDQAAPLAPRLASLDSVLANFDLANTEGPAPSIGTRYPFNWKVMFENNNDGYHANKLHHGPLHDFVPSHLASFPDLPEDTAGYYRLNGTLHSDASFNITQKALMPVFPKLTDEERNRMTFANIPPTLSLVMTSDAVIYLILRADGPESHHLDLGILFAPGAMAAPGYEHRYEVMMSAAMAITEQDLHVDELVQVGLRSRFAPRGRYSWQEGAQRQFNCWLVPRYRETWATLKPTIANSAKRIMMAQA
ncbi:aromatic ring-hydroxylating dioxygenase subunit alpha [soil metagenome]